MCVPQSLYDPPLYRDWGCGIMGAALLGRWTRLTIWRTALETQAGWPPVHNRSEISPGE
jgi:hypothetical protein